MSIEYIYNKYLFIWLKYKIDHISQDHNLGIIATSKDFELISSPAFSIVDSYSFIHNIKNSIYLWLIFVYPIKRWDIIFIWRLLYEKSSY